MPRVLCRRRPLASPCPDAHAASDFAASPGACRPQYCQLNRPGSSRLAQKAQHNKGWWWKVSHKCAWCSLLICRHGHARGLQTGAAARHSCSSIACADVPASAAAAAAASCAGLHDIQPLIHRFPSWCVVNLAKQVGVATCICIRGLEGVVRAQEQPAVDRGSQRTGGEAQWGAALILASNRNLQHRRSFHCQQQRCSSTWLASRTNVHGSSTRCDWSVLGKRQDTPARQTCNSALKHLNAIALILPTSAPSSMRLRSKDFEKQLCPPLLKSLAHGLRAVHNYSTALSAIICTPITRTAYLPVSSQSSKRRVPTPGEAKPDARTRHGLIRSYLSLSLRRSLREFAERTEQGSSSSPIYSTN